MQHRLHQEKGKLASELTEDLNQKHQLDLQAKLKSQREILLAQVRLEVEEEIERKYEEELQKRVSAEFRVWEEEYRKEKVTKIRESVELQIRVEMQNEYDEILLQEKRLLELEMHSEIHKNVEIVKQEAESAME